MLSMSCPNGTLVGVRPTSIHPFHLADDRATPV
jgi:hypothetical protein